MKHKEWQAVTISKIHWFVFIDLKTMKIGMFQTFQFGTIIHFNYKPSFTWKEILLENNPRDCYSTLYWTPLSPAW